VAAWGAVVVVAFTVVVAAGSVAAVAVAGSMVAVAVASRRPVPEVVDSLHRATEVELTGAAGNRS
jgi:hypothetical protein